MSFILKLFTRSNPADYSGTPMRTQSPVRDIPEQHQKSSYRALSEVLCSPLPPCRELP